MNLSILKALGQSCADTSPHLEAWLKIAMNLGSTISEEDFWGMCLNYDETPHLGNIFQSLVLGEIVTWCRDRGMDASCYVNALDTHLFVDGESISSTDDFNRIVDSTLIEDCA